ncbi:hypothetical protein Tco_1074901 [Tanacetum coccineum]
MSSVVRSSLKKETSTLGEIVSLNYIKSNKNDLALYDNESWNNPREFAKPVKAIALPQDVPSTSDRRLIELENQVQCLMEAYLAPTQPTQVNKIITSCEVYSGPHDTHNCMEVPEQTYVDYASSRTNAIGGKSTDSDTEEEDVSSTNACDLNLGGMVKRKEVVKEQGMEENEMETDMEVDEVIEEEESEFATDEEVEEILKEEEDDEDGRIRGLKVFIGSFAYECDFMILEDTTSIIDHHLGEMVFGRPFIDETGLVYNEEEGTVTFKQDDEKIMFKMPHTMKTF